MTTGPSTTQTPYIVGSEPNVTFTSILSVGDTVGGYTMVGVPDGIGAFDNDDGTVTILLNHELGAADGVVHDHGSTGAFVSELIVDKATLQVVSGAELIQEVFQYNSATDAYFSATTAFNRFCSSDLADEAAFFDAASGLGTHERIYLTGEENGAAGRGWAVIATGADKGSAYELPWMGNYSFENMVAAPGSGTKTVVMAQDDTSPGGQVYVYVGDKSATGTTLEKAGLVGGSLYGVKVAGLTTENNTTTIPGGQAAFTMEALGDVSDKTGAELETDSDAAGVTEFFRPEDGAWDPNNPNWYYFVSTADINSNSRLYRMEFTDIANPAAGGTIKLLLDGSEGQRMLDNITVDADGMVILQEDPGGNARLAKVWQYDPTTDVLGQIGEHDPARFLAPTAPFSQDEESSGVIDVSDMFGDATHKAYLLDVQAHYPTGNLETVQGGQLMLMRVEIPQDGDSADNAINGGFDADDLAGRGGDDTIQGGSNNDSLKGGNGDDVLMGGGNRDLLSGARGNDTVDGGDGDDALRGQGGDDVLLGGLGADRVFADFGADTMTGGGGEDQYKYVGSADLGDDVITDFEQGADIIKLKGTGDASFSDLEIADNTDGDAVVTLGNGTTITFENIASNDLRASDFFIT
jgi:Ca2+-binding RTX toxin-like protein